MAGFDLNYTGSTQDEQNLVAWLMMLFGQARSRRVNFEVQWEESAALCWPEYRNSFTFGHNRPPGMKYTEYQVDSTGPIASHRFMAIADALITPYTMCWSMVSCDNKDLLKDRTVQQYYNDLTEKLWAQRYRPEANFFAQNQQNWQQMGVFGNGGMFIDELDTKPGSFKPGLRYISTSPGEIYILTNFQGRIDGYIRQFRWTARQAYQKWGDKIPPVLKAALQKNDQQLWDFLQFVLPSTDYDPMAIFTPQGKPWSSFYVSVAGYCVLERNGYRSFPWSGLRYMVAPEEDYGRGPGQQSLPELKTLNSEKAMFLRQGHKAAEPAYLIADDGLVDLKTAPNAFNYGGLSKNGNKLVELLDTGQLQITETMMEMSKKQVEDSFLVSLFPLLYDDKNAQKPARQVIEEAAQRGIFLAPTLGRQYSEYVPTMITREIEMLSYLRLLPKRPPAMIEADGEYNNTYVYCSPLAHAMMSESIGGFWRSVEMASNAVQQGADPAIMDIFDFDEAMPDIAEMQFVPSKWMAAAEKIAAKRKARAAAQERDQQVKALPGQAAMAKAQAIQTKAATGGNIGGTLSGLPTGSMPMMPGQNAPGGRAFGQPGAQDNG